MLKKAEADDKFGQPAEEEEVQQLEVCVLTELQKQEAAEAKRLHRENIIKKQAGFKGEKAFIAKPSSISFIDFEVGKIHNQILTITNVSNAFNYFNVLPLPEKIRNWFEVQYVPKGKIAPGISNDIKFKFFPQLDEDIASEFTILAETGKIKFPIVCTSRKTIVKCDNTEVKFGKIVSGEVGKATLVVKNQGSLASIIKIKNQNGSEINMNSLDEDMKMVRDLTFPKQLQILNKSSKFIQFSFKPQQIGWFHANLLLYTENMLHSPAINIQLNAECVQVPVRVQRDSYDFAICLFGHIYREKLVFYNNGQLPMSFRMVQPSQSKKYFQFNPVIGYIQKQSKIEVWVKFTTEKDLTAYLAKYRIQKNTYSVPFEMVVKEQIMPITFQLRFTLTSEKIIIRPNELDFGTVFEGLSSKISLQLQNQSDLPQQVLLCHMRPNLTVKHDQPLLKLLPRQTIHTYLVYHSTPLEANGKPHKEEGTITCKIITGQLAATEVKINFLCEVVRPDICITTNKIDLPTLQIDQITRATTTLRNNANKELVFEIFVPHFDICGLKITPVVKYLPPQQQVEINIEYHSLFRKLTPQLIRTVNGVKVVKKDEKQNVPQEVVPEVSKKDIKKEAKLTKQQQEQLEQQQRRQQQQVRQKREQQQRQCQEQQRNFNGEVQLAKMGGKLYDFGSSQHYEWLLPVYYKQKDFPDASVQINYIEITTTSAEKLLLCDKSMVDFGEIAVGTRTIRQIFITNRGETAILRIRNLPIFCSFHVLNSMKEIQQGKQFKVVLEFQPIDQQKFEHRLEFYTEKHLVSCLLKGKGVRPEIKIEPESGIVAMNSVLLEEWSEKTVKIRNVCNFQVGFQLQRVGGGISNSNGSQAISFSPSYGVIASNSHLQLKVKFKPDRVSEKYFEKVRVEVQQQKEIRYFYVTGACYPRQAYLSDFKESIMLIDVQANTQVESAFDWLKVKDENVIYGANNKKVVLQYVRLTSVTQKDEKCYKRKLVIGSCKLFDSKLQKPTAFEVVMPKDDRFQCDNLKGAVVAGSESVITFTFKPDEADPLISQLPILSGIGQWKDFKAELKLSGGYIKPNTVDAVTFEIIFRVYVNQL